MNKLELTAAIAESAGISKAAAGNALNVTMEAITGALSKGDKVSLTGFGTFSTAKRPARTGRNPSTGKAMIIKAKNVVKFKTGKALAETVSLVYFLIFPPE